MVFEIMHLVSLMVSQKMHLVSLMFSINGDYGVIKLSHGFTHTVMN